MSGGARIRRAALADAAAIACCHVRSWQQGYPHAFDPHALAGLSVAESTARWTSLLADPPPGTIVLVAERGDAVVGFASVGPARDADADPELVGELFALYVDPVAWRSGVGRALLEAASALLRAASFRVATLWVLRDNPRARAVYEAAGWRPDGATKVEVHLGTRVPEVRYRTELS